MKRRKKSVMYLVSTAALGLIYASYYAVTSGAFGAIGVGRLVLGGLIGISPPAMIWLAGTELFVTTPRAVIATVAVLLHGYFIWSIEFNVSGVKRYLFEVAHVMVGPVPYILYTFNEK
jgi:membrane-bound ClpP family serine protease